MGEDTNGGFEFGQKKGKKRKNDGWRYEWCNRIPIRKEEKNVGEDMNGGLEFGQQKKGEKGKMMSEDTNGTIVLL